MKILTERRYSLLSDENITTVGAERFNCVDDIREDRTHVVLSGAMTMFQGIVEHMTNELTALAPSTMKSRTFSQTETPSLSTLNVSFTWKCCSSQISMLKEPVESTTLPEQHEMRR